MVVNEFECVFECGGEIEDGVIGGDCDVGDERDVGRGRGVLGIGGIVYDYLL